MEKIDKLNILKGDLVYYIGLNNEKKAIELAHIIADEYEDKNIRTFLGGYYKNIDIDKYIQYFKLAAKQGNIKALNNLGGIYIKNKEIDSLDKLIDIADNIDHNYAFQFMMAKAFLHENEKEMDKVIKECIDYNSFQLNAVLQIALKHYEKKKNFKKTFEALKILEKHYDKGCYYKLAQCYKNGVGTEIDVNKYFEYLILADDGDSNLELGNIYFTGQGLDVNYDKALLYFHRAYKKGKRMAPLGIALVFDEKNYEYHDIKRRDKWMEEFFKINTNNSALIEKIRDFTSGADVETKQYLKKLIKKYWKVEDFEA